MKRTSRILTAILCAVLTLGFTACQRDYEDLIIGLWEVVSSTLITTDNGTFTETPEEGQQEVLTFNKDLSCVMSETEHSGDESLTESFRGTYSISDDLLTMVVTYNWTDDEGDLHSDVQTLTFTIKTLDKDNLVLSRTVDTNVIEARFKRM